jgi:hypothetical protein
VWRFGLLTTKRLVGTLSGVVSECRSAPLFAAIQRHLLWARQFMAVGDVVGVMEELGDAVALAAEMIDDRLPTETIP